MLTPFLEIFIFKQLILIFIIGFLFSVSYDLLHLESITSVQWKKAVIDNMTHISLGVVSWLVSISFGKMCQPWNLMCCLLCGFFAGFVDIDHFLMARSLKLSDATNLPSRPPFHNTTVMVLSIVSFIFVMYVTGYLKLSYVGWIILVAVISHHLRDSLHRGLWLWPVQFKPMKSLPCLVLTYIFPLLIGGVIHFLYKPQFVQRNFDEFIV